MPFPLRAGAGACLLALAASPALAQPAAEVPPRTVTGQRPEESDQVGPLRGVQALTSGSATRTDTPLREIPQSVTVLPRRLLQETGAVALDDALRNAAGVVPESPLFLNQTLNTLIRGFPAEIYRDGLASFGEVGLAQTIVGVERLEVIRGPTGSLFGGGLGGGLGGALNIISRQPSPISSYEGGVRLGPYGYRNFFLDLNQAVVTRDGTQYMARLSGEHLHSRSYISNLETEGFNVRPTLTIRNGTTSLTLQAFFSQRTANDYPGLPPEQLRGTRFGFDRFTNANGANVPQTETHRNGGRIDLVHRFDEVFTFRLAGQYVTNAINQPAQFQFGGPAASFGFPVNATTYGRYNGYLRQDLTQATLLPTVEARFATGPVRHVLLGGIEFDQTTDDGAIGFAFSDLYDFARPTTAAFRRPTLPPLTRNTYRTVAGFLQDQATLWERVHLLVAARVTDLDVTSRSDRTGSRFSAETTRWTPRVGLGIDVLPGVTPYFGYGTGIRSPTGYNFSGLLQRPRPEESEQLEAGVKLDLGWGLSGTVAWFDITRKNVPFFDLAAGGSRQIGEQRSRGADLDLLWQPDPRLSLLASYAHTVAETVRDSVIAPGTPLRLVPRNAARGVAIYRLRDLGPAWPDGVTLSAGVTAVGGATTSNTADPVRTKGYTIFDAQIGYETGPLRVALAARNLGDRRYVIPFSYFESAVAPGAPREVYLTASLRF